MSITSGTIPKALVKSGAIWLNLALPQLPAQYEKIFKKIVKKQSYQEFVSISDLGLASIKGEGQNSSFDDFIQGPIHKLYNAMYSQGFTITKEAVEYNQAPELMLKGTQRLARSMRQTEEYLAALVLDRSTNTDYVAGDGKPLLATDHPLGKGGTSSNRLATDSDLDRDTLEDTINLIHDMVGENNLIIGCTPERLVVSTENQHNAIRLLQSIGRPGGADNDVNVLSQFIDKTPIVMNRLTDTDAFYVTTNIDEGLCKVESFAPFFSDSYDSEALVHKFLVHAGMVFGWGNWRGLAGSPGA